MTKNSILLFICALILAFPCFAKTTPEVSLGQEGCNLWAAVGASGAVEARDKSKQGLTLKSVDEASVEGKWPADVTKVFKQVYGSGYVSHQEPQKVYDKLLAECYAKGGVVSKLMRPEA